MSQPESAPVKVVMNNPEHSKAQQFPTNFIKTTKYNIFNFIPKNLYHQFKRVANQYFLVNAIVAVLPGISPVHPASAIMPLVFVIGVAMAKDGYEFYLCSKADARANSIETQVVRKQSDGKYGLIKVQSRDVEVGDIIFVQLGEELRADVILLSSSVTECQAFIDTCNLDGETNLKNRKAVEATWHLNSVEALTACELSLVTGAPDPGLLHWTGVLTLNGKETAMGLDQFLYRSCVLRNTDWLWGVVVYAGVDTKMFKNLAEKPPKMSSLDVKLGRLILGVLLVQNLMLLVMSISAVVWNNTQEDHWYVTWYLRNTGSFELFVYRYLTYFILESYFIPISLFVTIELCKVAQAKFMAWDHGMFEYMNDKWVGCTPNSSDLNEQLSQVRFIFSDKTGTLTENIMTYKMGNALGFPIHIDDRERIEEAMRGGESARALVEYWKALSICHTIQPFEDKHHVGKVIYEGSSPDEVALVQTAASFGNALLSRSTRSLELEVNGSIVKLEILATLEFTPDRKMMSIIVRDKNGSIVMYTKGADSFVIPQLATGPPNSQFLPAMISSLDEMAGLGLRTLIVCRKEISQAEFDAWFLRFEEAGKSLDNRSEKVDQICLEMEKDMTLVGATAIEDRLQDKVPETLKFFLAAKVVVWMLTGDKRETAVTIAATSSLADPRNDAIIHVDIGELPLDSQEAEEMVAQQLGEIDRALEVGEQKVTFVIDGPALKVAMTKHFDLFLKVSQEVNSAVCCRLTPLQKANVVGMFQRATGSTALAIGDGANDVSMIQEGRVGVGIVGLEGAQAALAADYAIPRFKHLKRLCCVHGRYALVRNAICILCSFYKNVMLASTQFYYAFFTGLSGQTLYDGWMLSFFNFAFTSLPPFFIGMFEKDLEESPLMSDPALFADLGQGEYFDTKVILRWFAQGFIHSMILFFVAVPTLYRQDLGEQIMDGTMVGTIIIMSMIMLALAKMALHIRYWIFLQVFAIVGSAIFVFVFVVCYSSIHILFGDSSFYYTGFLVMGDAKFWFYMLLFVPGLLITVDLSVFFVQRSLFPSRRDKAEDNLKRTKNN